MEFPNAIADFAIGQRIQMHPSTDAWMRGARFGDVIAIGRTRVIVKLDAEPRSRSVTPRNLMHVD